MSCKITKKIKRLKTSHHFFIIALSQCLKSKSTNHTHYNTRKNTYFYDCGQHTLPAPTQKKHHANNPCKRKDTQFCVPFLFLSKNIFTSALFLRFLFVCLFFCFFWDNFNFINSAFVCKNISQTVTNFEF